ncbi:hypothetical protein A3Q56_04734 [Intoshia linei]|uniref:Uncharacterized protein n=1 Tax=Intoshia linei TaxID=1819745 RepID=A0A177B1C3_9BILA|nr:hypothetical protein A3Q56_04734 [Intoshia linei]
MAYLTILHNKPTSSGYSNNSKFCEKIREYTNSSNYKFKPILPRLTREKMMNLNKRLHVLKRNDALKELVKRKKINKISIDSSNRLFSASTIQRLGEKSDFVKNFIHQENNKLHKYGYKNYQNKEIKKISNRLHSNRTNHLLSVNLDNHSNEKSLLICSKLENCCEKNILLSEKLVPVLDHFRFFKNVKANANTTREISQRIHSRHTETWQNKIDKRIPTLLYPQTTLFMNNKILIKQYQKTHLLPKHFNLGRTAKWYN